MTMNDKEILLGEVRTRIQEISTRLDSELQKLESQGVITKLDKQKLWADATTSAQAILGAINRGDFPSEMQRELVSRLINQFENSASDILTTAQSKLYSPERIDRRLRDIEVSVLSKLGPYVERQVRANPSIIRKSHDRFLQEVRSLTKRQQDYSLLEVQFQKYEESLTRLLEEQLPKLGTARETEVVHPEIKIEKPPDSGGSQIDSEKKTKRIRIWPFSK